MALACRELLKTITRGISTNGRRLAPTEVIEVNEKEKYYQKIGQKAIDNSEDVKPEGWHEARPFAEVPGPKPLPLLGNLWRFFPGGNYYNVQLIDLHKKFNEEFGSIAYLSGIPGKRPLLFIYDPDDIETTLRNEGPWPVRYGLPSFAYYRNHLRQDVFDEVGGLLTVQGEEWFQVRTIVNKILMQPRTAEMYVDSMDNVANGLIRNIRYFSKNNPKNEMPDNFQNELYKWTLESICVITLNRRIGCLDLNDNENSEGQKLINASVELFELMFKLDVLPSLWPKVSTRDGRRYVEILDYFTEVGKKYINEGLAKANPDPGIPDHERSVLERLAKVDKKVAFAMTVDMMIAGIDTTGRTMGSALYFLAQNPAKQEILRNEIKTFMPNKNSPVTKDMLRETPYLKAVIKEVTRLSPISVGTMRNTVKDTVLSGYQIPKGTDVLSVNILPALDDKYFPKSKEFIPERWLRNNTDEMSHKNVHPFVFIPFGFGPRSCIGKRLANLELEVGLSKVIRNFKLSWNYPEATFGTKLLYGIMDPLKFKVEEVED